jgi:hypothetical protein
MDIEAEVRALREEGYIEGELSIDPLWYIIWEPENLVKYNHEYEVPVYSPGFTAFGENGSNELLVIDEAGVVYAIPAIGMEPKYANKLADSIGEFKEFMDKNT